jgi:hypothetical protein
MLSVTQKLLMLSATQKGPYHECVIMQNVVMLSVVYAECHTKAPMLCVIILDVIMLSVIMLTVTYAECHTKSSLCCVSLC